MQLTYEVTPDHLKAFARHHCTHAPHLRQQRRKNLWSMSMLFAFVSVLAIFGLPLYAAVPAWVITILGVVQTAVRYPAIYIKNFLKIMSVGENLGLLGMYTLRITDGGLFMQTVGGEGTRYWRGIDRVEVSDGITFVYFGTLTAVPVPEGTVLEGDYEAFITEMYERYRQARLSPPA